jgi:hypothetical protein
MPRGPRSSVVVACTVLLAASLAVPVRGQARLSGMVFADAQDALHGFSTPADSSTFRFRRVQFTLDQDLDSVFAVRLQFEADDNELTSKGKAGAFLKQAWLRWHHLASLGDLAMGLSPTPTWAVVESYWGYRSLEKTLLDVQGLGAVTDLGVALLKTPAPGHPLGWHLMLANGNGQKPENNASKKLMLSVPYRIGNFVLEGMGDFEGDTGPRDKWTAQAFVGWQNGPDAAGVQLFRRVNAATGIAGADVVPVGASVFGHRRLNERWRAVGRVDWFDPDTERRNSGYCEWYGIAALDASPHPNVHFMPNVLVRSYSAKDSALPSRRADVTVRVTLYYLYK